MFMSQIHYLQAFTYSFEVKKKCLQAYSREGGDQMNLEMRVKTGSWNLGKN